jgi:hypothetical protein
LLLKSLHLKILYYHDEVVAGVCLFVCYVGVDVVGDDVCVAIDCFVVVAATLLLVHNVDVDVFAAAVVKVEGVSVIAVLKLL